MTEFGFTEAVGFTSPVDNPVLLAQTSAEIVAGFATIASPVVDVRAYNSFSMYLDLLNGTAGDFDRYTVQLQFFSSPSGGIPNIVYFDAYSIFKTQGVNKERILISGPIYGPYMRLLVTAESGVTVEASYQVYGSYRVLPGATVRTRNSKFGTGVLLDGIANLNPGISTDIATGIGYGPALVTLQSGVSGAATLTLDAGILLDDQLVAAAANQIVQKMIIVPRRQIKATMTNTAAAVQSIKSSIIQQIPFA